MCSINGWVDFLAEHPEMEREVRAAGARLARRGPDGSGAFFAPGVGFFHNRLAVMDVERGKQPMSAVFRGASYTIVYNGEIYNQAELRRDLVLAGAEFHTGCDTETVLWSYIVWGEDAPVHLNGIFAFAVYDEAKGKVFLARDRLGVKPLFYSIVGSSFYFASEAGALFAHAAIKPEITKQGLWQLLFLTPVTLPGSGVFRQISELLPGYAASVTREGFFPRAYWKLEARECRDSAKTAAETVRSLLSDATRRQLNSDVPLAVLLSGGLDSSALAALAAGFLREDGVRLSTYSFEYEGNRQYFRASLFQPQGDDAFAGRLAEDLGTDHTVLTAPTAEVAGCLNDAVRARDLPGQADIDSSLLYYCREIKARHTVLLSGECSDEIFGGYPWFYRPEMLEHEFFPWLHDPTGRIRLFDPELVRPQEGLDYLREVSAAAKEGCPLLHGECAEDRRARIATWLSTRLFMTNLLARKDRMSMYSAVEVRVPFSDHRILEYVFNVPWAIKFEGGVEKALLRHAMEGALPDYILHRKKSPYPKTHNPEYEKLVREMLAKRLNKKDSFLARALDRRRLSALLEGEDETWFGQLMARAQLLAWLCQLDTFFEEYGVKLV